MNYKELADKILQMSEEKQKMDISIICLDTQKVIPLNQFIDKDWNQLNFISKAYEEEFLDCVSGVLEDNHPVLQINAGESFALNNLLNLL